MSDIIKLVPKPPAPPKVHDGLVEGLEHLIQLAKAGEITGVVALTSRQSGGSGQYTVGAVDVGQTLLAYSLWHAWAVAKITSGT